MGAGEGWTTDVGMGGDMGNGTDNGINAGLGMNVELDRKDVFEVRYVKLHFMLEVTEDTCMPRDKVSAFRGGIGEMLLRCNCIRNRDCEVCDFQEECIVRRVMYSKSKIKPRSVTEGESMGYVFECENREEEFWAGDRLELRLILFGNSIIYFNQYLQALSMLGQYGLGKNCSKFYICGITSTQNQLLLDGSNILMQNYKVDTLQNYVSYRMRQLEKDFQGRIVFYSPAALKYVGVLLTQFHLEALYKAALRRLYMLDCYEGIEMDETMFSIQLPYEIARQKVYSATVARYSNHKRQKMYLNGISGTIELREISGEREVSSQDTVQAAMGALPQEKQQSSAKETFLKVMLAGEVLHIGKNTSFGFGRYWLQ